MAEALSELTRVQWGVETTPGVAVPANRLFTSFGVNLGPMMDFDEFTPAGYMDPTIVALVREESEGDIDGRGSYNDLTYLLNGALTTGVITTPGGATLARRHRFLPNPTGINTPLSFTVERYNGVVTERAAGCRVQTLGLDFGGDNLTISGMLRGGPLESGVQLSTNEVQTVTITGGPTGGSFTLTYAGQTTGAIVWNATAAAVQTALEALSNIEVGDVNVTGGPGPATAWLVEFRGTLGQQDVAAMTETASFTGGTIPDSVVTTTTPGVAPTAIVVAPVMRSHVSVYIDPPGVDLAAWDAAFGTTKLTRARVGALSIADRFSPFYAHDSANVNGPATWIERRGTKGIGLTMMRDATAMALLANTRNGDVRQLRVEAVGPLIEAGQNYKLTVDLAVQAVSGFDAGEDEGAEITTVEFRPVFNATWTRAMRVDLVNSVTAL